jgi:hypothetical protein
LTFRIFNHTAKKIHHLPIRQGLSIYGIAACQPGVPLQIANNLSDKEFPIAQQAMSSGVLRQSISATVGEKVLPIRFQNHDQLQVFVRSDIMPLSRDVYRSRRPHPDSCKVRLCFSNRVPAGPAQPTPRALTKQISSIQLPRSYQPAFECNIEIPGPTNPFRPRRTLLLAKRQPLTHRTAPEYGWPPLANAFGRENLPQNRQNNQLNSAFFPITCCVSSVG